MDPQQTNLGELARWVGGTLVGDASVVIIGAAPHYEVQTGQITLVDGIREGLDEMAASAVIVGHEIPHFHLPQIISSEPREAFARIVARFLPQQRVSNRGVDPAAHIDPTAIIGPGCEIDRGVVIGAHVVLGRGCRVMAGSVVLDHSRVGDDCVLYPNVTLYERTVLGERVTIHAGSVLGAHGFGYRQQAGRHHPTAQLGYVVVENDVEIGACVTIDRGTYGSTRIGEGTKIDNQVMIAHNCQIGRHNLLCSQVGIAGSCVTGDHVVLAGQVGLKDHIRLGDRVIVAAQSGVMADLASDQIYLGSPATTQRDQMQIMAVQRRLPEMRRSLKQLEQAIERLEQGRLEQGRLEQGRLEQGRLEQGTTTHSTSSTEERAA